MTNSNPQPISRSPILAGLPSNMCVLRSRILGFYPLWLLALAGLALAQQQNSEKSSTTSGSDQKQNSQQQSNEKQDSQPLFKNKLGYQSSKTSKESTTLGFNGIDPSGKVDKQMMAKVPSGADQDKVKKMAADRPPAADVKAFLKEGGLNEK